MSKKSYFLGLGIGITVTALILGISFQSRKTVMSDDEIIARAKELDMIENTVIAELEQNDANETQTEKTEPVLMDGDVSNTEEVDSEEADSEEADSEETDSEEATPTVTTPVVTPAETTPVITPVEATPVVTPAESTPVVTPAALEGDAALMVTIVISAGESSVSVSKKLAQAGLVEDATAYDAYLCSNGYDKRITVGSHPIPNGASLEEIAKIITSKQ